MVFFIVIYVICAIYMVLNFKYDLQMFQQNSYRPDRFWRWLRPNIMTAWRLVDVACLLLLFATQMIDYRLACLIVGLVAIVKIFLILKKKYKKPLVLTKRVWRLYILTCGLSVGGVTATAISTWGHYYGIYAGAQLTLGLIMLIAIISWGVMLLSYFILTPVEKKIQNGYIKDAKRILNSMPDLKIIGITGSYGKTSTKHYLTRILSEDFDVLMTPGSFNTPMGVVRTIREYMKPYNEIFVCEMGAKQLGDIKEICDIVHPSMGIVTAVGPMHLESFKTLENVCATKFELVDDLPADGCAVINNDFEASANRPVTNTRCLRYGVTNHSDCDYIATDIKYSSTGTTFTIVGPSGLRFEVKTRLLGECNVSDLLAASVIALNLGMKPEKIKYAISTIEQVEHRLSIKTTPGGVTILDDAFNSNPAGSKMAVDVLSHFRDGKRIIVTPGMIELGTEQFRLNKEFGKYVGEKLDIAILVGEYNRKAIIEGIKETAFNLENLHEVATFTEAQTVLARLLQPGDAVLYENDLPDTFK